MAEFKKKIGLKINRIFDFIENILPAVFWVGRALVLIFLISWIFWEWEPFKGQSFHRLAVQQNYEIEDNIVTALHEVEIRVDAENQRVLGRLLQPNISLPAEVFREGVNYDDFFAENLMRIGISSAIPGGAVYDFRDCVVFSGADWSCEIASDLFQLTHSGRIGMSDGKWFGLRGEIFDLRVMALIFRMRCGGNICNIRSAQEYEGLLESFIMD